VVLEDQMGPWLTFGDFEDREWFTFVAAAEVGKDGVLSLTIDLESRALAGIDFFLDALEAEVVDDGGYVSTYLLLPQQATVTQAVEVARMAYPGRVTMTYSVDDAGKADVVKVVTWDDEWDREALVEHFDNYYPHCWVEFVEMGQRVSFPVGTDTSPPATWYVPASQMFSAHHPGIDVNRDVPPWGDVDRGEPVLAVLDGRVHYVTGNWGGVGMLVVKHELDGVSYWVQYAHVSPAVQEGEYVQAGQPVGYIADWRGGDGGDHLHFAVASEPFERQYAGSGVQFIDPVPWLKRFLDPVVVDAMLRKDRRPVRVPPSPKPPKGTAPPTYSLRSGNVLGLHCGHEKDGWGEYWGGAARPTVLKVFSLAHALRARALTRDGLVVWRRHADHLSVFDDAVALLDLYSAEIEAMAKTSELNEAEILERVDIVESLNEEIPSFNQGQIEAAVAFDVAFAELLHARYGDAVRPGLLTVPVGNPHASEVALLVPAARAAVKYGGVVCYHAYWAANEERSFLVEHWDDHAGRWMQWDREFRAAGVRPRYLLSEGGICYAPDGWSFQPNRGWRACGAFGRYLRDMETCQRLMMDWNDRHGNRCAGLTLFAYGQWGWDSFDMSPGELQTLAAYATEHWVND
jgi:hypothetical protein